MREGAIGNTHVRPSVHSIPFLSAIEIDVRLKLKRPLDTAGCPVSVCYQRLISSVEKLYFECIVSLEELCVLTIGDVQLVCRIANLVVSKTYYDTMILLYYDTMILLYNDVMILFVPTIQYKTCIPPANKHFI